MNIRTFAGKMDIDYDALMEDFCGDAAALKDRIQTFNPSALLESLKSARDAGDSALVHTLCHKIRKGAEGLHLTEMAKAARRIEDGIEEDIDEAYTLLEREIGAFCEAVKN